MKGTITEPERGNLVPPGPKGLPILGIAAEARKDTLGFFSRMAAEYDGISILPIGMEKVFLLNDPDALEHIFVTNWRGYRKSDFYNKVRPLFGNGIATSEGEFWRRQRQLMNPAFHRDSLHRIGTIMRASTAAKVAEWQSRPDGQTMNVSSEITKLSLAIVMESLFGADAADHAGATAEAVDTMLEICERRVWALPDLHGYPVSPLYWRHRHARATLDRIMYDIIDRRCQTGNAGQDLLGMLLSARDPETGEGMTNEQLRDETTTLLVTGHESTANAIVWAFYTLAHHPEIEAKVRAEIAQVCGGETPTDQDLQKLTYQRMVISEVMRLYPPAWTVSRTALADDVINGYPVPAGSSVMVSPYVIHRNPRYWPDPAKFDPSRFLPEQQERRPKFSYIAFGGGPRSCIGSNFAMMEMQLVITMLFQAFRLELAPQPPIEREAVISIRPKHGIRFTTTSIPSAEDTIAPAQAA
ncbi:MAG: cytochrome P450 [Proteobacteria bacterium]|nr:cytochrome P450 [Pseudomonadota bacterium]